MDRVVSCLALLFLVVAAGTGMVIFGYQFVGWLRTDIWQPIPLDAAIGGIRQFVVGFAVLGGGGRLSAYLYMRAARAAAKAITPAQVHA
jgi:hypothetical protein